MAPGDSVSQELRCNAYIVGARGSCRAWTAPGSSPAIPGGFRLRRPSLHPAVDYERVFNGLSA
eukprot:scaffold239453_cov20-Prasinocladus_malaysianus.AAC.1